MLAMKKAFALVTIAVLLLALAAHLGLAVREHASTGQRRPGQSYQGG